ncbi:DUF2167 domain-containing protein [Criblamydia sequanensis]|uniref:Conserved putative membrane protein n=1 Tax=Candidatus Criblamydia sequanensis CRIB-18 TaxID=1437425 RepID=A0A090CYD3_9BACT|nr:DUF2167 domain-containing protein [Criblamydia sequanensis]CDR33517.1 Conserved putative membrane protein [Criblamydia sequanensis CRIB-18]
MLKFLAAFLLGLSSIPLYSSEPTAPAQFENISEEEKEELQSLYEMLSDLPEKEREIAIAFYSLDWKDSGTHKLEQSNSTISLPEGYRLLIGDEAKKGRKLTCGDFENPNLEATVYNDDFENVIIFENLQGGYVSIDDWEDLDPESLLKSISENTEKANEERKKNGFNTLHVVGWVQKPLLDKLTNTVYWAIEAESADEGAIVNSVALRLGREGFEKIVWVTQKESYVPFGGHLEVMLRAHSFDPGYRYSDYKEGDKMASYGIAALVAATMGGKIIKASGFFVILKKLSGILIATLAAIFYKLKNIFKHKNEG